MINSFPVFEGLHLLRGLTDFAFLFSLFVHCPHLPGDYSQVNNLTRPDVASSRPLELWKFYSARPLLLPLWFWVVFVRLIKFFLL